MPESTPSTFAAPRPPLLSLLTPAERLVASRLLYHESNPQIADALGKSRATIKTQVSSILHKFGQPSRGGLVTFLREME